MLFYEFFRSNIGSRVQVMLKTGICVCGVLCSVDPYLNIKLQETRVLNRHPGLGVLSTCSIRGSSVKFVLSEECSALVQSVNAGSRLRMVLER